MCIPLFWVDLIVLDMAESDEIGRNRKKKLPMRACWYIMQKFENSCAVCAIASLTNFVLLCMHRKAEPALHADPWRAGISLMCKETHLHKEVLAFHKVSLFCLVIDHCKDHSNMKKNFSSSWKNIQNVYIYIYLKICCWAKSCTVATVFHLIDWSKILNILAVCCVNETSRSKKLHFCCHKSVRCPHKIRNRCKCSDSWRKLQMTYFQQNKSGEIRRF